RCRVPPGSRLQPRAAGRAPCRSGYARCAISARKKALRSSSSNGAVTARSPADAILTAALTTPIPPSLWRQRVASAAKQRSGFWTQSKLQILEDYLAAFLTASSLRAKGAVYLDAFAGEGAGRD